MWAYGMGALEGIELSTQSETLEWLREHGFRVNRDIEVHDDLDAVVAACRRGRTAATAWTSRSTAWW